MPLSSCCVSQDGNGGHVGEEGGPDVGVAQQLRGDVLVLELELRDDGDGLLRSLGLLEEGDSVEELVVLGELAWCLGIWGRGWVRGRSVRDPSLKERARETIKHNLHDQTIPTDR